MKLSIGILAASASTASARMKETEVQDAYFAGEDIVLSNPATRSNKQWHDCGKAPPLSENARAVECSGDKCAVVCPIGWRAQGRWMIRCKADNTWSHSKFSPCVTCPSMTAELDKVVEAESGVAYQQIMRTKQNLPWVQFFCGADSKSLNIKNKSFPKGSTKRNVKCICKNGRNGDPSWKKSCDWEFRGQPWSPSDVKDVQCKAKTDDKKKCPNRVRRDLIVGGEDVAQPEYLTVPSLMECTGEKDMGDWSAFCKPAEQPEACPKDSWEQLFGECGVGDDLPICDQKKKKCDERNGRPDRPDVCIGCSAEQPYEQVPEYKKCATLVRSLGVFRVYCKPAEIPEACPVDSWLQLYGECGVADFEPCPKNCDEENREILASVLYPEMAYLKVKDFDNCTGSKLNDSGRGSEHCEPAEKPEACLSDSWERLFGECGVAHNLKDC